MFCFLRNASSHPNLAYFQYTSSRFLKTIFLSDLTFKVGRMATLLGSDRNLLVKDIKKYKLQDKASPQEMEANVITLLDHEFSSEYIIDYIHWIAIPPLVLRNRLQICEECGCSKSKTAPVVLNFTKFFYARTAMLRAYGILQQDRNDEQFFQRLMSYLDLNLEDCLEPFERTDKILDIYNKLYNSYILREIPQLKAQFEHVSMNREKGRITSLQNFRKNVKFLLEVLKFNTEEIVKYKTLLFADCGNMMALLESAYGLRIKEAISEHPELLDVVAERYETVYKLIKDTRIDFSVFLQNPGHFKMDFKEFEYHFSNSLSSVYLSVFKYHHRLPLLVERGRIANERIHILKHLNMKCYNLDVLIGDTKKFLRFVGDGIDKVKAEDTLIMLSGELNQPFDVIERQLKKNAFIEYVSIAAIKENLDYLRKIGFSDSEIFRNIQLLLYPKEVVYDNIMKIHLSKFTIYEGDQKLTIDRRYYLSLALYNIEKEHNFSGTQFWKKEEKIESIGQSPSQFFLHADA